MTKKVKRTISLIIAAIMLLSTMSVLAFADKLPTYGEITSKEVGPHDCVRGLETEDKAAYAQPTCAKAGSAEYVIKCTVCGKELSRRKVTLPKLTSHVPCDKVSIEDVVAPTCAKTGSYNEVIRCRICGKVLEKTPVIVARTTAHVAGKPVKVDEIPATCASVGSYWSVIRCSVCGIVLQSTLKEIPKLTYHVSRFPAGTYTNDKGTFTRTCADGEDRCLICGELLNPAIPHVYDKGTVTRRATISAPGEIVYTCLICGFTKTENTPVKANSKGDVDSDGDVTTADARLVLRYAVGLGCFDKVITGALIKVADYDSNGKVEPADARMVLRAAVRLPN